MKNVKPNQLKKAIFYTLDEFRELVYELCGEDADVDFDYDGLSFSDGDGNYQGVTEALEEYFNVTITSIHADDCDYVGVWIIYREEETA